MGKTNEDMIENPEPTPEFEDEEETKKPRSQLIEKIKNYMISPTNKRMKIYHLLVSLTLYVDFWITSWILGNYRF